MLSFHLLKGSLHQAKSQQTNVEQHEDTAQHSLPTSDLIRVKIITRFFVKPTFTIFYIVIC